MNFFIKKRVKTYVNVGRSSYSALNRMNRVEKGSVSSVVAMTITLAKVPTIPISLRTKSSKDSPLFTPLLEDELLLASPNSTTLSFIMFNKFFEKSLLYISGFRKLFLQKLKALNLHGFSTFQRGVFIWVFFSMHM